MQKVFSKSVAAFLIWSVGYNAALAGGPDSKVNQKPNSTAHADYVAGGMDDGEEISIGREIAGELLGAVPLVRDNSLQKYVNNVGAWVAMQSERPNLPWHFGVIDSNEIGTYSAPGGYVFVTRGLYVMLQSEAELAGVLAHEIAHVARKHRLKLFQEDPELKIGNHGKGAGQSPAVSGMEVALRPLSQETEFEADRIGVVLAARAGYDPFGLASVLQEIGRLAGDDGRVALLGKTHPAPGARLERLGAAIGDRFDDFRGAVLEDRLYRLRQ